MATGIREKLSAWLNARKERRRGKLEKDVAAQAYDRRHESSPFYDTKGGPN